MNSQAHLARRVLNKQVGFIPSVNFFFNQAEKLPPPALSPSSPVTLRQA